MANQCCRNSPSHHLCLPIDYCCTEKGYNVFAKEDFIKKYRPTYKPNVLGTREAAMLESFRQKAMDEVQQENEENRKILCPKILDLPKLPNVARFEFEKQIGNDGAFLEKQFELQAQPALTFWTQKLFRPNPAGFIEGSTPCQSRLKPFHKNSAFTTPLF